MEWADIVLVSRKLLFLLLISEKVHLTPQKYIVMSCTFLISVLAGRTVYNIGPVDYLSRSVC
jgi:uncharacterized membrane protein YjdF